MRFNINIYNIECTICITYDVDINKINKVGLEDCSLFR